MSTKIKKISDNRYSVNDKIIYRNMDGNWVTPFEELSPSEHKAFRQHLKAIKAQV